ncbi:MAG: pilus assembly protein PilC, partial [Comamonadaceae bacterium]
MTHTTPPGFRKSLLALAAIAVLAPHGAWALDLATAPAGTKEPYVAPNVIISIDDSGSMDYRLDQENANSASNSQVPGTGGVWPVNSRRVNVLKYALIGSNGTGGIFRDTTLLPDGKIRLAWQAMHNNGKSSNALNVDSASMNTNSMRSLDSTHRGNFISFINSIDPGDGTPSHLMFKQADDYMRRSLSSNSPWASKPGTTGAPYLACRRSYHIMMTDGRWNGTASGGEQDNNAKNVTLPDGTVYGSTVAANRPNTKLYSDAFNDTLADWAFKSWAVPAQTSGMTGTLQPTSEYRQAPATENFGDASKPAILDRYWNPRYNPATWPHMVTYTIGFSQLASSWPGASTIIGPTDKVPFGYDGSFPDFVTGTKTWPKMDAENKRSLDLWHAALNGRGRFYAVEKGEDLEKAFREILGKIATENQADLTSTAASGSNNTRSNVGKFVGGYEPVNAWKGFVTAETVQTGAGDIISATGWEGNNTAARLDALTDLTSRVILSWSDEWKSASNAPKGGVSFNWATDQTYLSTAQKALIGLNAASPVTSSGEKILSYIRGDRTEESATKLRVRKSRQGDIINSVVWYTGAPASNYPLKGYAAFTSDNKNRDPVIYVGGNDGMLHGFAAADGKERIAYVPRGVIGKLKNLVSQDYNNDHQYFVDGSPMTGDVDIGTTETPNWRTMLVSSLGLGGKGYFVLDVTNPSISNLSATNANTLVQLDRTRGSNEAAPDCATLTGTQKSFCDTMVEQDKDIGHITAQ